MGATSGDADERFRQAMIHAALRNVVHDLNNPLGTITMAAAALRSAAEGDRAELIDLVEREAMRAGATASAAAERTMVRTASEPLRLHDLVTAVRESCRSARVDAIVTEPADPDLRLSGDRGLLPQALAAFVVDAAGAPGRREPVQVRWRVEDAVLELVVDDDGDTVTAEHARRPFRPFPPDGHTHARGFGLPVAAGRYLVRSLGGRVELQPRTGGGNTVRLRLPVVVTMPTPSTPTDASDGAASARRALVVDDDRTMRDMLEVVLRRDGWETAAASDGPSAAAAVRTGVFDLVLLDVHVGAEHGPDIAARLETQRPGLSRRVVYLSGDVPPSGRIGDRPAIAKPFVLDELYRVADAVARTEGPL